MKYKYFYMGLGAIVTLLIGGFVFSSFDSTQAVSSDEFATLTLSDDSGDLEHRRGKGKRGDRDNSALLEELGVTEEEWDAAKAAVREAFADAEEKPDREAVQALFAEQLGVTVEEIEAAKETVRNARLDEALANGDITQEEYDLIKARQALSETIDRKEILAEILGVSADDIQRGNLRDLIEESGLTREELHTAGEEAYEAAVADAVANGVITQEQADALEEARENREFGKRDKGNRGNGRNNRGFGQPDSDTSDA